jgi:predicted RNase H-related nuclease YkuK (DUF458 family)
MFTEAQISEIVDILCNVNSNTKIYLGCDSVRYRKENRWFAKYATVCIIHLNGKNGCKLFSNISHEPDFDVKRNRPKIRMMNEVQKVCALYTQLAPFIDEFEVQIHLDINPDVKYGSSCAVAEATGYVLGSTGLKPKLKPDSFASSFGADHIANHNLS